jgi:hypothetical protein
MVLGNSDCLFGHRASMPRAGKVRGRRPGLPGSLDTKSKRRDYLIWYPSQNLGKGAEHLGIRSVIARFARRMLGLAATRMIIQMKHVVITWNSADWDKGCRSNTWNHILRL